MHMSNIADDVILCLLPLQLEAGLNMFECLVAWHLNIKTLSDISLGVIIYLAVILLWQKEEFKIQDSNNLIT